MSNPLRVGVIGLGPLWKHEFLPALRGLREQFQLVGVCDAVACRAERQAQRLGCVAAAGPAELFGRQAPEAILLCDAQWWLLWPVELACRHQVPILCCPPLDLEGNRASALAERVIAAGLPAQPGLLPRQFPATQRLCDLFITSLGPPRRILCWSGAPARLAVPPLFDALDWCCLLFAAEPQRVHPARCTGLRTLLLDFGNDRTAQATALASPGVSGSFRAEVWTERGSAVLHSPYRLSWRDADGRHLFQARSAASIGRATLSSFHEIATRQRPPQAAFAEAQRLLARLEEAKPLAG